MNHLERHYFLQILVQTLQILPKLLMDHLQVSNQIIKGTVFRIQNDCHFILALFDNDDVVVDFSKKLKTMHKDIHNNCKLKIFLTINSALHGCVICISLKTNFACEN